MRISVTPLVLIVTVFAAAFAVTGCSTVPSVGYSESKISVNTSYENFALLPIVNQSTDRVGMAVLGESAVSLAATKAILEEWGYTNTEYAEADFLVELRSSVTPNSRRSSVIGGSNNSNLGGGHTARSKSWRLSVVVFDKKSYELVWSGWADTLLIGAFEEDLSRFRIIERILERFPD